jgi:CRP-like cAMP-binding protein
MQTTRPDALGSGNRLLDALPEADRRRLVGLMQPIKHPIDDVLYEFRGPINYLYFPTGAVMSALTIMADGSAIEVATVGREGLIGHTVVAGDRTSANRLIVQIPDGSLRIETKVFQNEFAYSGPLRDLLGKYNTAFMAQVSQSVACNGLHQLEKRCCRWLLMTRDRMDSDDIPLTHEFLGFMLGVRRASVSDVLAPLQTAGLLRSHRGVITLLNRGGLESLSCECYRFVRDEYERLLSS